MQTSKKCQKTRFFLFFCFAQFTKWLTYMNSSYMKGNLNDCFVKETSQMKDWEVRGDGCRPRGGSYDMVVQG